MENKFKKGLILGGLLTAAAVVGIAMSKHGQELTEELQKDLKLIAKNLKKSLHKLHDVTKKNFNELAVTAVEEYAKNKELTLEAKKALTMALQAKWHEMEEEYLSEKSKK